MVLHHIWLNQLKYILFVPDIVRKAFVSSNYESVVCSNAMFHHLKLYLIASESGAMMTFFGYLQSCTL